MQEKAGGRVLNCLPGNHAVSLPMRLGLLQCWYEFFIVFPYFQIVPVYIFFMVFKKIVLLNLNCSRSWQNMTRIEIRVEFHIRLLTQLHCLILGQEMIFASVGCPLDTSKSFGQSQEVKQAPFHLTDLLQRTLETP